MLIFAAALRTRRCCLQIIATMARQVIFRAICRYAAMLMPPAITLPLRRCHVAAADILFLKIVVDAVFHTLLPPSAPAPCAEGALRWLPSLF